METRTTVNGRTLEIEFADPSDLFFIVLKELNDESVHLYRSLLETQFDIVTKSKND